MRGSGAAIRAVTLAAAVALLPGLGCSSRRSRAVVGGPLVSPHPFFVCVLPLAGDRDRERETGGGGGDRDAVPVDGERTAALVKARLEEANVFTRVEVLEGGDPAAALERARSAGADILLELRPLGRPAYRFSRRNGWFVPNSLLWVLLGFPSWWVRDRVYEVEWEVGLLVHYTIAEREPLVFESARVRREVAVCVAEQGLSWPALVMPPGFYEGPDLPDVLVPATEDMLAAGVADRLRSAVFQFDEVRIEPPAVERGPDGEAAIVAEVHSRAPLEWFSLDVDGQRRIERTPLDMIAPDLAGLERTGRRRYRFTAPAGRIAGRPGPRLVRIIARLRRPGREASPSGVPCDVSKTFAVSFP